jgi:hypothetical protein
MIKVYIKPFDSQGNYTEFIDVSSDIKEKSIGTITEAIDFDDFGTGGIKISDFKLTIQNRDGLYSDTDGLNSIFRYKRSDSIVKIVWNVTEFINLCGMAICGQSFCGDTDVTVYEGVLNDDATTESVENQDITFKVLGFDSILSRTNLPASVPAIGQTFTNAIYAILNQAPFNELVTVDLSNVAPPVNETFDDVTDFEDDNAKSALDKIYTIANAVMTLNSNTVYVSNRDETAEVKHIFRGQASTFGEDIQKISAAKNGLNRTFNYVKWGETPYFKQDTTSIEKYLLRDKVIESNSLTLSTKIEASLDDILAGFSVPKKEFELTTNVSFDTVGLQLLDKVKVDYPTPLFAPIGEVLPIYGLNNYGESVYPFANFTIKIDVTTDWKIIQKKVNLKSDQIILKLREV